MIVLLKNLCSSDMLDSDSDISFNINMFIYITQEKNPVYLIIKLSIHVYVLEVGQRLVSQLNF